MYLEYWGLSSAPFGNAPNAKLFFPSPQHEEALLRLVFAVEERKGVAMLTGEVGAGKTTVSRAFVDRISGRDTDVAGISNPAMPPEDFVRAILLAFDEPADAEATKSMMLHRLRGRLTRNMEAGLRTVLVVDEAHVVDHPGTFEELRMLLNLQSDGEFLMTLILMGQPPLVRKIAALQPLRERIAIHYDLPPLDFANTVRYLLYRLKSAGSTRGIFTKDAVKSIYNYSSGIPLRVNSICDHCLLLGMMRGRRVVGARTVLDAVEELRLGGD